MSRLSGDNGQTFGAPRSTGLIGQTTTPFHLGDNRLLCVYRRKDELGLWAVLARIGAHAQRRFSAASELLFSAGDDGEWVTEAQSPIWGSDLGSEQTQDGFKPEDMSQVTAAQRPVPPLAS